MLPTEKAVMINKKKDEVGTFKQALPSKQTLHVQQLVQEVCWGRGEGGSERAKGHVGVGT